MDEKKHNSANVETIFFDKDSTLDIADVNGVSLTPELLIYSFSSPR